MATDDHDSEDAAASGNPRVAIVVFARLPVPGRVKTRLAAGIGPEGACDFYRACAAHAIHQAASCSDWADVFVYHSSADDSRDVAAWLAGEGLALPCIPQVGGSSNNNNANNNANSDASGSSGSGSSNTRGVAPTTSATEPDLGSKMLAAMADARQRSGGAARVLIMGTDIPDLSAQLLQRAADALRQHQVVLGPSLDGGYYLMGLTRLEGALFRDMKWSSASVLHDTVAAAARCGLRLAPLECLLRLRDVDTREDLEEWVASQSVAYSQQHQEREQQEPRQQRARQQQQQQEGQLGHQDSTHYEAVITPKQLKQGNNAEGLGIQYESSQAVGEAGEATGALHDGNLGSGEQIAARRAQVAKGENAPEPGSGFYSIKEGMVRRHLRLLEVSQCVLKRAVAKEV